MRISMILGNDFTRDNRVRREAQSLAAVGHRVTIHAVLSDKTEPEEDDGEVLIIRTPLPAWCHTGSGAGGAWRVARWYERFAPLVHTALSRSDPEVLHAHDLDTVLPSLAAARSARLPLVYDDHEASQLDKLPNYVPNDVRGVKKAVLRAGLAYLQIKGRALERRVRRVGVAGLITVSGALADDLVRRFGGPRPVVLRNCPPYRTVQRTDALRRRIGAYPDDRLILYHGTVTEGCGVETAIRAMKTLGRGHVLAVLGWAWRQDLLEQLAESEGVADRVKFVPGVPEDEMYDLVASADVGVIPTEPNTVGNTYGIPNKLFESLMAGTPVVASDVPEVGAIVRRTGAGVLYPSRTPQDPGALAEGIHTLLYDRPLWETCSAAGLAAAKGELNWDRESNALLELYERVERSV
jgi:glycosyltransferase involved in cell wall biosynthesis